MEVARNARSLAVVTGASSGIGFELANVFAAEGFDLLIAAEDEERYERIQATGRPVAAICGSLKNKLQVAASKVLPDSKKAQMHREMAEPGSAEEN